MLSPTDDEILAFDRGKLAAYEEIIAWLENDANHTRILTSSIVRRSLARRLREGSVIYGMARLVGAELREASKGHG
jgi:hypothetical protein